MMDIAAIEMAGVVRCERGQSLIDQWNARVEELGATAVDGVSIDLPSILMVIMPLITALVTGGFSPTTLLALIPQIITVLFPQLDSKLGELLVQIVAFILGR